MKTQKAIDDFIKFNKTLTVFGCDDNCSFYLKRYSQIEESLKKINHLKLTYAYVFVHGHLKTLAIISI